MATSEQNDRESVQASEPPSKPSPPLEARSAEELYAIAREKGIAGRSRMNKIQLIRAIRAGR